jgi:DNA (cytosine-5)-methyltransferase 1
VLTFGSLFAGIGGMDLGLERAGMVCKWQVEIDEYARRVLEKHWPNAKRHDDVRTFPPKGCWHVDLICGGFPCQDISSGGRKAGIHGERSGLWFEFARTIRALRPSIVIVENVGDLAVRGLGVVLGELAKIGLDAEWQVLPASAFSAPHQRERLFIVAYDSRRRPSLLGQVFRRDVAKDAIQTGDNEQEWRGEVVRGTSGRLRLLPGFPLWRMADGVPDGLDGLKALGNAVVPQVAEWIGRRIMERVR